MKREQAIKMLLGVVQKETLMNVAQTFSKSLPFNYALHMMCNAFKSADTANSWFTAFGVLSIYQRLFAGQILQKAVVLSGHPPLSRKNRRVLLDAIASGAKLTRADAG